MKVRTIQGVDYRLPNVLNEFQLGMYLHLINWKWSRITREPGHYNHKGQRTPYDAILPDEMVGKLLCVYEPAREWLRRHRDINRFRLHLHFNHMASSQAANVNLFLPILTHPRCNEVLASVRPDFASLATDQLDGGYCLEYWGGNFSGKSESRGPLGDKSDLGGTDADLAIAYRNQSGELCLWLLEHKLTEAEFTPCGGYRSNGRTDKVRHDCTASFAGILQKPCTCYHHDVRLREYWNITARHGSHFANHAAVKGCPFKDGMNQLWRNTLLALAVQEDPSQPYQHASFSVVKHPDNSALDHSLNNFWSLIGENPAFSVITSDRIVRAAEQCGDTDLSQWASWYRDLYNLTS